MVGRAYLATNMQVGGIRHQFRNTATGMEAKTLVEFPAACPSYIVNDHCLHLALEWKNWIRAAQKLMKDTNKTADSHWFLSAICIFSLNYLFVNTDFFILVDIVFVASRGFNRTKWHLR